MKIARVESLVYGVDDMESGVRYYEDWVRNRGGASFIGLRSHA